MKQFSFRFFIIVIVSFAPFLAVAQGFGLPAGFELKKFEANQVEAMFFLQYDSAWQRVAAFGNLPQSKDVICYPDKRGWKVVAGTVDSSGFKEAAYYIVDGKNAVTLSKKKFDTVQVANMGRALFNANKALAKLNIKIAAWKKFTRLNTVNQSITVWAFPDVDASGNIWYGPECAWYFGPNGESLITSKIVNKPPVIAGKTGTTLSLSCPTEKMPTIGAIWLAHRWKLTYNEINVSYKTGTSTLHYNVTEKTYAWDHTAN